LRIGRPFDLPGGKTFEAAVGTATLEQIKHASVAVIVAAFFGRATKWP